MRTEIVVFDAECLVCSAWVQFLLRADKKKRFGFASIQSATGMRLVMQQGLAVDGLDTMLLKDGPNVYLHTDAIIRVLVKLGGSESVPLSRAAGKLLFANRSGQGALP